MAHHLFHPQLAQTLRAICHRIGTWAVPDDEAPTLILEQPVDLPSARPLHRIHTPACMANSCSQGRTQCRTPEQCYLPSRHESASTGSDFAHAVLVVLCTLILVGFVIAGSTAATWADAMRVLSTFAGV